MFIKSETLTEPVKVNLAKRRLTTWKEYFGSLIFAVEGTIFEAYIAFINEPIPISSNFLGVFTANIKEPIFFYTVTEYRQLYWPLESIAKFPQWTSLSQDRGNNVYGVMQLYPDGSIEPEYLD